LLQSESEVWILNTQNPYERKKGIDLYQIKDDNYFRPVQSFKNKTRMHSISDELKNLTFSIEIQVEVKAIQVKLYGGADFDYDLRAQRKQAPIVVSPTLSVSK
jgi:hypothetical protein